MALPLTLVPVLAEAAHRLAAAAVAAGTAAAALVVAPVSGGAAPPAGVAPHAGVAPPLAPSSSRAGSAHDDVGPWGWPLSPVPRVVRPFERPPRPWDPGHRGVDLAARPGQDVLAPAAGVVSFVGVVAGRGVVVVTHRGGLRSTFEPVRGAGLPVGAPVRPGEPVAVVTAAPGHCAPATCLHWGVLRGRTYLDPLALLGRGPVVLLPLR